MSLSVGCTKKSLTPLSSPTISEHMILHLMHHCPDPENAPRTNVKIRVQCTPATIFLHLVVLIFCKHHPASFDSLSRFVRGLAIPYDPIQTTYTARPTTNLYVSPYLVETYHRSESGVKIASLQDSLFPSSRNQDNQSFKQMQFIIKAI
jgi:hypothetical protein